MELDVFHDDIVRQNILIILQGLGTMYKCATLPVEGFPL